jgi:hypothetical protein
MKTMKFSEAMRQLNQDTEIFATERARFACFQAGLSKQTDQITRRLRAILGERLGVRIIAG